MRIFNLPTRRIKGGTYISTRNDRVAHHSSHLLFTGSTPWSAPTPYSIKDLPTTRTTLPALVTIHPDSTIRLSPYSRPNQSLLILRNHRALKWDSNTKRLQFACPVASYELCTAYPPRFWGTCVQFCGPITIIHASRDKRGLCSWLDWVYKFYEVRLVHSSRIWGLPPA